MLRVILWIAKYTAVVCVLYMHLNPMNMKRLLTVYPMLLLAFMACRNDAEPRFYDDPLPALADGYVGMCNGEFVIDGEKWFPLMLNYKAHMTSVGDSFIVSPASYYHGNSLREHFDTIASWGFDAIRVCLDVLPSGGDTAAMFRATRRMLQCADSAGLRVMLLIKPPFDPYWQEYTKGLLRHLADMKALWAYDFMNEPLYFDPEPERDKMDAARLVSEWRHWVRQYAPHQLFTVSTSEPIEVFEWDPAMLPVDFIEMHTYHPLRVCSEMWWYSHYCGKPWMVGETGLPADNDSVPHEWQTNFLWDTWRYAKNNNAIGYGWWEFQDCPQGANFEGQYTGMCMSDGKRKRVVDIVKLLRGTCLGVGTDEDRFPPINYYNMLAYSNICLTGMVVDSEGNPIEGAVIRGWNDDWSVGMNTYTDTDGHFTLYSNDYNVHFEVSAPNMSHAKFDRYTLSYTNIGTLDPNDLPNRTREYQQIDYMPYMHNKETNTDSWHIPFDLDSADFFHRSLTADMGTIKLMRLKR